MMIRNSITFGSVILAMMMAGCCCGPYGGMGGCGVGGGGGCVTDCNDCEGVNYDGGGFVAAGPLQHLAMLRKSLVCGGGCGEVYYGEWRSTPPDACDPCCNDQFVGGATPCRPFCWQWRPGSLLFGFLGNIYGQRLCEGCGNSAGNCGCGIFDNSCGGNWGGGYGGQVNSYGAGYSSGGSGCATCNSTSARAVGGTRIANPAPVQTDHRTARANAVRRGVSYMQAGQTQYR